MGFRWHPGTHPAVQPEALADSLPVRLLLRLPGEHDQLFPEALLQLLVPLANHRKTARCLLQRNRRIVQCNAAELIERQRFVSECKMLVTLGLQGDDRAAAKHCLGTG
ncbi:hypothetical protein D9M70_405990 [compost metagenome]